MHDFPNKLLVNFRVESYTLRAFDNACYLTGSNRTQILRQLISSFTAEAGAILPKQISEQRGFEKALKNAVRRSLEKKRALAQPDAGSAVRTVPRQDFAGFVRSKPIGSK